MSIEENKQLSLRQLHALPFILANPSLTQASKESGVSEKQIWEWMNQDHFRKEVILRKNNLISEVTKKLQQSSSFQRMRPSNKTATRFRASRNTNPLRIQ